MSNFPDIKWLRKLTREQDRTGRPAARDEKQKPTEKQRHARDESPGAAHRWNRQETKAKIAEARKKWTWHDSCHTGWETPSPGNVVSLSRRPVYRMHSDSAKVVKGSPAYLHNPIVISQPKPVCPRQYSQSPAPVPKPNSTQPKYVKSPPPAGKQEFDQRTRAIQNSTYGAPLRAEAPSLPRMTNVKKTLKRSASAIMPRAHIRPYRNDSHHENLPLSETSSPYGRECWDLASCSIPALRYDDLPPETKQPMIM
jgi:hypothetical protein